jgi:hypothetical protein
MTPDEYRATEPMGADDLPNVESDLACVMKGERPCPDCPSACDPAGDNACSRLTAYIAKVPALEAEVAALRALMREAADDFHGKSVLFSSRYLAALTPKEADDE